MIQDIHPHRLDMTFRGGKAEPEPGDFVVALRKGKMLFAKNGDSRGIPVFSSLAPLLPDPEERLIRLFSVADRGVHFYNGDADEPEGHAYENFMSLRDHLPRWEAFAAMTAGHLGMWYAANRFCGGCGAVMICKRDERAVVCPRCGMTSYPRISPAVIVGVVDRGRGRILMTRYRRPGSKLTALIAGFVEVGETVEGTVRREVFEEAGVRVKNIRYYKSQPWAFSGSVLLGFYADLDGSSEIVLDGSELEEARWLSREEVAPGDSGFSLTSEMTERFRIGEA